MIRHGEAPFLECSSKGDKRFSAFGARLRAFNGQTIETIYQASKVFADGSTGLHWREGKGRKCVNQDVVRKLYSELWDAYLAENPQLMDVLLSATGLSDIFGQAGHACQATELWRIRCAEIERRKELSNATMKKEPTMYATARTIEDGLKLRFLSGPFQEFPVQDFIATGEFVFKILAAKPELALEEMRNAIERYESKYISVEEARMAFTIARHYVSGTTPQSLDEAVGYDFSEKAKEYAYCSNGELQDALEADQALAQQMTPEMKFKVLKMLDEQVLGMIHELRFENPETFPDIVKDINGWKALRMELWRGIQPDWRRAESLLGNAPGAPDAPSNVPKADSAPPAKAKPAYKPFSFSRPRG